MNDTTTAAAPRALAEKRAELSLPIYMDYAATTPTDPEVVDAMSRCLTREGNFGNPASRSHVFGWKAEEAVEQARAEVAALIGADPREIIWTSGATESNNLAIKGAAQFHQSKGRHIVTSAVEHKAVLDTCRDLERLGWEVSYLEPLPNGAVSAEQVRDALRDDTVLVSAMHANNEIGTITDIAALGALTRERGVLLHVDAAQSVGKIPVDVQAMNVDLLSITSHKLYGPKGIGALYVRRRPRVRLQSQMHGGGHERGLRSGTLPTHQIVGMGAACRIAAVRLETDIARLAALRERLWSGIEDIEEIYLNGDPVQRLPGNLNFSINYVEGESLIMSLSGIAISSGSACTSASLEPSYVLRALGLNDELAHSSLRFSLGRYTTEAEVDYAIGALRGAVDKLRALSPLWEMYQNGVDMDSVEWQAH